MLIKWWWLCWWDLEAQRCQQMWWRGCKHFPWSLYVAHVVLFRINKLLSLMQCLSRAVNSHYNNWAKSVSPLTAVLFSWHQIWVCSNFFESWTCTMNFNYIQINSGSTNVYFGLNTGRRMIAPPLIFKGLVGLSRQLLKIPYVLRNLLKWN